MTTPLAPDAISEDAVVRRAFAVDGDRVERVACRFGERAVQQRRRHLRIGRQEAQHRGHVRLDHARALGHAADSERAASVWTVTAYSFGNGSVVMMARAASLPLSRASARRPIAMPASTLSIGELDADDAGRGDQHLLGPQPRAAATSRRHLARVGHALRARAGVGAAAVDDDRARAGPAF